MNSSQLPVSAPTSAPFAGAHKRQSSEIDGSSDIIKLSPCDSNPPPKVLTPQDQKDLARKRNHSVDRQIPPLSHQPAEQVESQTTATTSEAQIKEKNDDATQAQAAQEIAILDTILNDNKKITMIMQRRKESLKKFQASWEET